MIQSIKFIDEAIIKVTSGNGGNGCISFYRAKNIPKGGPDGGNGGNGGNIYLIADNNLNTLEKFNFKKEFIAQNGFKGMNCNCTGKNGKNTIITLPVGTFIFNKDNGKLLCIMNYNKQKVLIAKGGKPGLGNNYYKSSINRIPYKYTHGTKGESIILFLEMKLIADVGMLGLPNSGKSTFIQSVSSSKTKIADYPFTTLIPHLGVVYINNKKFVIADIPGLIKGSSKGIGLGLRFLKHLERCSILLHIVDISPIDNSNIIENIRIIIQEINSFNSKLIKKTCWLVFNKIDLIKNQKYIKIIQYIVKKIKWKKKYYAISAINKTGIYNLCLDISNFINHEN